jgi:sialate O-acetylesterase
MVKSWRNIWQDELPFYFVQIAPCTYYDMHSMGMENICAELQEAQRLSLDNMPNSGMVVSLDTVSDYDDIHPKNKKDVGERLAKLALNKTYNHKIVCSGPLYKKMDIENDSIRLYFAHTEGGLVIKQAEKNWFEIAGSDGQYYPADVKIQGDSLVLSSIKVTGPTAARYGWSNTVKPTLFNGKGFPASSFRTDNSKWETEGKLTYF